MKRLLLFLLFFAMLLSHAGAERLFILSDLHFKADSETQELREAVRKLPAGCREVVLLHYFQGYGIAEISQMLGVPEGTISSRLSRARKKLEELLKGE